MGLRDRILEIPVVLRLLGERDEFFAGGYGEDAKIFVLGAVFELDRPLPGRHVGPPGGEVDVDHIGYLELSKKLGALCLKDANSVCRMSMVVRK